MKKKYKFSKLLVIFLCLGIIGCASIPKGFLKPDAASLEKKQLQMRQYGTTDEKQILAAVAGVFQDLGFTLDSSETKLGFVAASKKADAVNNAQVFFVAFFAGSNAALQCDGTQVVKASVITKPSLDGQKIVVRVTFQRIIWNLNNQVSRVEGIDDLEIYQKFYDALSKAIFLEAQKI